MTISSVTSKVIYVGTGSTAAAAKIFAYPFKALRAADLTVTDYSIITSVGIVKTLDSDYVVSGVGVEGGGNVTLTGSYTSLPTSSWLVIQREVDLTQTVDYVENDPFSAETHEGALDKLTMEAQQLQEQIDRCIKADIAQTSSSVSYVAFATLAAASSSSAIVAVAQASNAYVYASTASAQATVATSSATVAVSNAASNYRYLRVTLVGPTDVYTVSPTVCLLQSLNAAITVNDIEVTCDANPTTQLSGNVLYADSFIGTANPVIINDFNTTSGVRKDVTLSNSSVAVGKCIYMVFNAEPVSTLKQVNFNIRYTYQ